MITLKNVNKYFFRHKKNEIHVINDTSLEFEDKGLVALLGPSGSGKTTLLNAVGGLDRIDSGAIYIDGVKMPKVGSYGKDKMRVLNIGYIFQDYNLLENMSVYENVALSLKMIGFKNKAEIKERVDYILDLVGMYRYRNKPAGNLSGGQRQRVGIARALVKNPQIIIADEPTGNLDSKNTIEIMNIIKTISEERLVILVTHEKDLAQFYASRIVTLVDGKIESDIDNKHDNELDYRIDNKIYLKDFKSKTTLSEQANKVTIYSDKDEEINLDIVIKNGNIYVSSKKREKIEVVNEESGIELVDDHYKKIQKTDYEKNRYDLSKLDNANKNLHYSSIYNVFTMLKTGFKKISNYTLMKKILLLGFFFSAMFIIYAFASIFAAITIKDSAFMNAHRDYIVIKNKENRLNDYLKIQQMTGIKYVIPGDSQVNVYITNPKIWQLSDVTRKLEGSIAANDLLKKEDIIAGKMPEKSDEVVVDKSLIDKALKVDLTINWLDLHEPIDYVGIKITVGILQYEIVGISDSGNPCMYFDKDELVEVLANKEDDDFEYNMDIANNGKISNYERMKDKIVLVSGRIPKEDYEILVHEDNSYQMPLEKEIEYKIGDKKLKVVGYYTSSEGYHNYIGSKRTHEYATILDNPDMLIVAEDKAKMIEELKKEGFNAIDNYDVLKSEYKKKIHDNVVESLVLAGILLAVSFIEIFLMIRASFLSRIKEVGIYRAIGVKKSDIYKMFLGEILIITTIAGMPGGILMSSILNEFSKFPYLGDLYVINSLVITLGILTIYLLNIVVGLLPIRLTLRKTPAEILSRTDVD